MSRIDTAKPYVQLFSRRWLVYCGIGLLVVPWVLIVGGFDPEMTVRTVVGLAYMACLLAAFDTWSAHRKRT